MADRIDNIIDISIAALVGIIVMCAVVIPVGVEQIASLTGDSAQYAPLFSVVLTMTVVGLIIFVVRYFSTSRE